ncbi:VRR-NUC domain-containing protein [Pseudomonas sp. LS1212]|uniref:VRR-NUC domain-containing protein n=1 Tax=Pseudomonas sp. LS1212 TaxID=2972478 RepID=UPI00215C322F|nr:VRR-NUC domain-containing protein [Pseudomonas sp. LS1212]UVJ46253.1 VRR-NUC domain-containing protein [Pseudomonas sp. LS1212]
MTSQPLEDPFYYLHNFSRVLDWLEPRYADLFNDEERRFLADFRCLPKNSQALLVRMVMRKGPLYRASKLSYAEIGSTVQAVAPLLEHGWVDDQFPLNLEQLFQVLVKPEIVASFGPLFERPRAGKAELLAALLPQCLQVQAFRQWCPALDDHLYVLKVRGLCDRLRLLFFGNLYQDWTEFVLADLGLLRYETVELSAESRALRSREDLDTCLALHACGEQFEAGADAGPILDQVLAARSSNPWLERRRGKLLFQLGQHCERSAEWGTALTIYQDCVHPEARLRTLRVLERSEQYAAAMALARDIELAPGNAAESQQLMRIMPRLRRKLGQAAIARPDPAPSSRLDLTLPRPLEGWSVEQVVQAHLNEALGPVHYVENTLLNSLFGLLCWPAIFAPIPGAFFHPFQSGPADLHQGEFRERRAELFAACLAQLDDGRYKASIREHYRSKWGLQSPFVFCGNLSEALLEEALLCLPAEHLKHWFERLLGDIQANRAGMPDLIQFWPQQQRYRMIEVKGPGDRLQDNQLRWIDFCSRHGMPVTVCYVQWQEPDA